MLKENIINSDEQDIEAKREEYEIQLVNSSLFSQMRNRIKSYLIQS